VRRHLRQLRKYFDLNADTPVKKKRAREIKSVADKIYADRGYEIEGMRRNGMPA
jgi:hypothetical protein